MLKRFLLFSVCMLPLLSCIRSYDYDIIVVGGGASGTAAAVQAARDGADVLLVEEHIWLGGMLTSAGVSATDGCYNLRGGFWSEFRDSLETRYGGAEKLKTGWVSNILFEPSAGADIFSDIASHEENLDVIYGAVVSKLSKDAGGWKLDLLPAGHDYLQEVGQHLLSRKQKVSCRILVDGTELGDVARMAGVPYDLGMDSRQLTGESNAAFKANDVIQDITYVAILKDYHRPVPMERPEGYEPEEFRFCCNNRYCIDPPGDIVIWSPEEMLSYGRLPGDKYMINWPIHGNDIYMDLIEMGPENRAAVLNAAKAKTMRFIYFMHDELGFDSLALADDEFPTEDRLPFIPYHRESRRIHGKVQMTLEHIKHPYMQESPLYRTSIAVGDYPVDQHHIEYDGDEILPDLGLSGCPIPSYGLPAGVMIPRDVQDLLVIEKSISVTNLVNGTTRLQPVVLQLGQAAGVLAAMAVEHKLELDEVPVREVQSRLLDMGAYLVPVLDLQPDDPDFKMLQRVLLTGLMKYEGKNEGWSNQSWFYKDRPADFQDVCRTLEEEYRPYISDSLQLAQLDNLTGLFSSLRKSGVGMTRLECARLLDESLHPFQLPIGLDGNYADQNIKNR